MGGGFGANDEDTKSLISQDTVVSEHTGGATSTPAAVGGGSTTQKG